MAIEQLDNLINKKTKDAETLAKFINENKEVVKSAREAKKLSLEAYRVSISNMQLDILKYQLSALFELKTALNEIVDEKYKNLLNLNQYLEVKDGEILFKAEDVVKELIEKGPVNKTDASS